MPLIKPTATISKAQNGVGAFILQCKRLDFHYCDWAGSSRGMNAFLKHALPSFARTHPQIEISVSPRPRRHPIVVGHYVSGTSKAICVRKMEMGQVLSVAERLRDHDGKKLKRVGTRVVESIGGGGKEEGVRGGWSPYHGDIHRI